MSRAAALLLAVACLALASCGKPPTFSRESLIGKWKAADGNKTIEFRENGTMAVVTDLGVQERRYEFRDGRKIVFEVVPGGPETEMVWGVKHLDAERLVVTMWDGDTESEYRRQP